MILEYYELTKQLVSLFKKATIENLLEVTEESEAIFLQREKIIQQLSGRPSEEDKLFYQQKIAPLDEELNLLLNKNHLGTATELRNIQVGKKTHDAYHSFYDMETPDGIFYDKRK